MNVWYNDNDPFAAAWLRELIRDGNLPQGRVDERGIEEIQPHEIPATAHFFAGIGGWPYALRLAGVPDDFPVWTGSCPCQPISCAGKRLGHEDERHLWPSWFRLIRKCRPQFVFGEQVASRLGIDWLDAVHDDLETCDYTVGAVVLPASSVGAPHARHRIFWAAYALGDKQWPEKPRHRPTGRMGRKLKPVSWDRSWWDSLREFRAVDDGLSYGVEAVDGPRNAIVPQVAAAFITAFFDLAPPPGRTAE